MPRASPAALARAAAHDEEVLVGNDQIDVFNVDTEVVEGDVSSRGEVRREGCIQTYRRIGIQQTETIGADHAHAEATDLVEKLLLALPSLGADFGDGERRRSLAPQ